MKPTIHHWPELPALPALHEPVLVRVVTVSDRRAARQQSRAVLREILASWSGRPMEVLALTESARGPVWPSLLHGGNVDISLSYVGNEIWIALLRGGRIGVDAMKLETFPEIGEVARNYFDPVTATSVRQSANPARAFGSAWATLEARVKCLKLDLVEWSSARDAALTRCTCQLELTYGDSQISFATALA